MLTDNWNLGVGMNRPCFNSLSPVSWKSRTQVFCCLFYMLEFKLLIY
jgi:hypothetical protein